MLTLVLHNFARPANMLRLIAALREQTVHPRLVLWDNATEPLVNPPVDWHIRSSKNDHVASCRWLWQEAETEFVGRIDDDLLPTDDRLFEDALAALREARGTPLIVGAFGVNVVDREDYVHWEHVATPNDAHTVDFIKGRVMLLARDDARRLGHLQTPHVDLDASGFLATGRRSHLIPGCFHARLQELPEGPIAYSRMPGHHAQRERHCRRWLERWE